jgi:hypothetical protein
VLNAGRHYDSQHGVIFEDSPGLQDFRNALPSDAKARSAPMDISFDCDKCGKHLVVDEAGAGITIDCPGCGKPLYVPSPASTIPSDEPARVEVKSATPKATPISAPKMSSPSSERRAVWSLPSLEKKYNALRTLANFCQFMAVPTAIIHVLVAFLVYRFMGPLIGPVAIIQAGFIVVVGVFSMVVLFGAAESIRIFIDIEENTRATRQMMEYELHAKYRTTSPSTEISTVATPSTHQSAQAASRVRFDGLGHV